MAALSYKGMERGKCAECGEVLYINKETGLCITCENAVFRESITILTVMLAYEQREVSRLRRENLSLIYKNRDSNV